MFSVVLNIFSIVAILKMRSYQRKTEEMDTIAKDYMLRKIEELYTRA